MISYIQEKNNIVKQYTDIKRFTQINRGQEETSIETPSKLYYYNKTSCIVRNLTKVLTFKLKQGV